MKNEKTRGKQKTENQLFVGQYTLKQFAAFCLASNWAYSQFENLVRSQHFFKLFEKHLRGSHLRDSYQERIKGIRNFFSHTTSHPMDEIEEKNIEDLEKVLRGCLTEILYVRKPDLTSEVQDILGKALNDEKQLRRLFNFHGSFKKPDKQPEIAFLLSPFLSRSQMGFLSGKIYFGRESTERGSNTKPEDTPLTEARKRILGFLASPDSIVLRGHEGGGEPWLSPGHEQGFAIWGRLEKHYNEEEDDGFPEEGYFMKQLLLFVERCGVLSGISFARVQTEIDEDKINQKISFGAGKNCPFAIRHNTIQICFEDGETKGTMGLQPLKYIVGVYLRNGGDGLSLAGWLKSWYKENNDYPRRRVGRSGNSAALKERVLSRLQYLKELNEKDPKNLQGQVRFVCRFINNAYKNKYERNLNKKEYQEVEEKVRFYRKDILREYLEGLKILDMGYIQLGRGDEKMLRNLIKGETIQELHQTLNKHYRDWLTGCEERIHKLKDDEVKQLGDNIGLRKNVERKTNPSFPIGITTSDVREEFCSEGEEKPLNFLGLARRLAPKLKENSPSGKGSNHKKEREKWARRQLLFAMAYYSIKNILPPDKVNLCVGNGQDREFPRISETPIGIDTGNHKVTLKLSQSWRNHTHYPKGFLEKLIKTYLKSQSQVPFFRADEDGDREGFSVESAIQKMRNERFILIQALLKWEKEVMKREGALKSPPERGYVPFGDIAEKERIDLEIKEIRNKAFHDGIASKSFSEIGSPIKEFYDEIQREAERRREAAQKRKSHKKRQ